MHSTLERVASRYSAGDIFRKRRIPVVFVRLHATLATEERSITALRTTDVSGAGPTPGLAAVAWRMIVATARCKSGVYKPPSCTI